MNWTREQDQAAKAQGWLISNDANERLEIQKLDDAVDGGCVRFDYDDDAQTFVHKQATSGDALAQAALAFLREKAAFGLAYNGLLKEREFPGT